MHDKYVCRLLNARNVIYLSCVDVDECTTNMCVGCLMLETLYDLSCVDVDECTTNMCVGCLMLETLYIFLV